MLDKHGPGTPHLSYSKNQAPPTTWPRNNSQAPPTRRTVWLQSNPSHNVTRKCHIDPAHHRLDCLKEPHVKHTYALPTKLTSLVTYKLRPQRDPEMPSKPRPQDAPNPAPIFPGHNAPDPCSPQTCFNLSFYQKPQTPPSVSWSLPSTLCFLACPLTLLGPPPPISAFSGLCSPRAPNPRGSLGSRRPAVTCPARAPSLGGMSRQHSR